jgi:hypothetical protein
VPRAGEVTEAIGGGGAERRGRHGPWGEARLDSGTRRRRRVFGFARLREVSDPYEASRTRTDLHRTVLIMSCLDPTVSGLTGDVALSGARGLVAGFLGRDASVIPELLSGGSFAFQFAYAEQE